MLMSQLAIAAGLRFQGLVVWFFCASGLGLGVVCSSLERSQAKLQARNEQVAGFRGVGSPK